MPISTRRRTSLLGVSLIAFALASVSTGATVAAVAAPLAAGAASASKVPISKVGLGWSIAEVSAAAVPNGHSTKGKTTLYAVGPQVPLLRLAGQRAGSGELHRG